LDAIEEGTDSTKARPVVVLREKRDAFRGRNVLPVASTFANERARVRGVEFQSGGTTSTRQIAFAQALALADDLEAKTDARGIAETLRIRLALSLPISDTSCAPRSNRIFAPYTLRVHREEGELPGGRVAITSKDDGQAGIPAERLDIRIPISSFAAVV
jgi:hypothetical protein